VPKISSQISNISSQNGNWLAIVNGLSGKTPSVNPLGENPLRKQPSVNISNKTL
jgi:hypothetical protein